MKAVLILILFLNSVPAVAQDANLWMGIIGTKIHKDNSDFLLLWTSRGTDQKAVLKVLGEACRQSSSPKLCRMLTLLNKGCGYISTGTNVMGEANGGYGDTPQAAYDKCYFDKQMNCTRHTAGGCANPADDVSPDATSVMPSHSYWIAFASTVATLSTGQKVPAGGLGWDTDPEAATRKAIIRCEQEGEKYQATFHCKALNRINSGCQYATPAVSADKGAKLIVGSTKAEALENCQNEGYSCDDIYTFGSCVREIPASRF